MRPVFWQAGWTWRGVLICDRGAGGWKCGCKVRASECTNMGLAGTRPSVAGNLL